MKHAALLTSALIAMQSMAVAKAGEETVKLKAVSGHELVTGRCAVCHSLDYIEMNAAVMDQAGWERTVRKMIDRFGAPISDEEAKQIVQYLGSQYSR